MRRIRESTDVFIECDSHSNPSLNEQIQWYFLPEPTSLSTTSSKVVQHQSLSDLSSAITGNNLVNTLSSTSALNSAVNLANKQAIERIFSKHVPSKSRATHSTSLLFLDSNSADSWIKKHQFLSKNDEDVWLSFASSTANQITQSKNNQIDLKYFQPVTGGNNVIVADSSLVLQKVHRSQRGLYACSAANSRGRTYSKPIFLDVNCKYFSRDKLIKSLKSFLSLINSNLILNSLFF